MEQLAAQQPGYLSFKSFTAEDGEVVSVSEWENEACALAWRKHADHLRAQWHGREAYYDEYTVLACDEPRIRRFKREDRA